MKLHHIGIACENIDDLEKWVEAIGGKRTKKSVYDPHQSATLTLFELKDGCIIEAVNGSVVSNYTKRNILLYHICYEVESFEATLERMIQEGGTLVSEPKEALLFDQRRVCFLDTPMGLVELLEAEHE